MRDVNYWKTRSCRRKVVKKIYRSVSLLKTFEGNPYRESIKFENYFFTYALDKEEYFSGFVRLVLYIRKEISKQGKDAWPEKPDRIDALKGMDLPQTIPIPLMYKGQNFQSILYNIPYNMSGTPKLSQVENSSDVSTEENPSNTVLQTDLSISPENSITGDTPIAEEDYVNGDGQDELSDDDNFDATLENLSQNLFFVNGFYGGRIAIGNNTDHVPANRSVQHVFPDVLTDDELNYGSTSTVEDCSEVKYSSCLEMENINQRIWVTQDLYSPYRGPMPMTPYYCLEQQPANSTPARNIINEILPSTRSQELLIEDQARKKSSSITVNKETPIIKEENECVPDEHIPSIETVSVERNKKRRAVRRKKLYTSSQLKQMYYKKKIETVQFDLKCLKYLHKLDCAIQKKQIEKM